MKTSWKASVSVAALICATAGGVVGAQAQTAAGGIVALPEVVVSATPLPSSEGGGIEINKVPGDVSIVTSKDFIQQYSPSVTTAITSHVPAAVALSVDGSDLSPDLFYRGFDASRISGTSAGLAVYENGVRINENFGDSVNLDLIPPIALASSEIYTNNPIFGLNALGGAINFTTKNGFNFHGGDVTVLGGSYGRANGFGEFGKQSGNFSFYFAGDVYRDGGYRPFGAQNAQRFLADLGYRSQDSETHLIGQFGRSLLGVQGTTPQVLVQQQYNSVFTTPQTTNNQAGQAQLLSRFDITPHWSIGSSFYVRQFDQYHVDGNDADVADCGDIDGQNGGTLCQQPLVGNQSSSQLQFRTANGGTIPSMGNNTDAFPYGTTALTSTHTTSFGTQLQATNKDKLFGHDNYFVVGGSVDTGNTSYTSRTVLGQLNSNFQNILSGFPGAGEDLNTASNVGVNSTFIHSNATYYGLFALDTFNVTNKLAFTAGARANFANIAVQDVSGADPELNSSHNYDRINPVVGATYTFSRALNIYAGYSEANRAPTPLESECADPTRPCVLETALVSDPRLNQVVSHTIEAGARGIYAIPPAYGAGELTYKAGYYRINTTNDIISEPSAITGQGYFVNAPETLREGAEVGLSYIKGNLTLYGNYALVDATYRFNAMFSSPNNPFANNAGNIQVTSGDSIPGIPRNLGKAGFEYRVTPRFTVGADATVVGSQYYVSDDANQNPKLPSYYFINAHASYALTDHVQVFGIINNLTNNHYATYGTFYGADDTTGNNVNATLANNANSANPNANAVTVAQPLSVFGGVKVLF